MDANKNTGIAQLGINTVRVLAADAVQKANSGHPGTPMGLADITSEIYLRYLRYDPKDPNYRTLQENRERLQGEPGVSVVALPMPDPLIFRGQRLPASYANFYIANAAVLVPTFNDPQDRVALGILAECFPDRRVIGIHSSDLVWGLGTLHCLTQQEPARGGV